jgi:hypothetical protein
MSKNPTLALVASVLLAGCSSGPTNFTKEYREAIAARPGVSLSPQSARAAVGGFAGLYGDLSVPNVTANARKVYALDAWFNDTIATEVGIDAIEKYLLKTAEGAEIVSAKVNDIAVSGSDCYVRWTMEIRTKNLAGGQPIITEGVSQLRFDDEGRIVLHQDFWNPATGIYQHLPLLGPAIRFVNGLIVGK